MSLTPVCANRLISSIFVANGIEFFSFCSPSLAPTSTIRTSSAQLLEVAEKLRRQHCCRHGLARLNNFVDKDIAALRLY